MSDWNAGIIEEFRANNGIVGGMFEGKPVLLLHHVGAKTGTERVNPLMFREEGATIFLFASKAGADSHPDWYYNLKANPAVNVEVGTDRRAMTASEIDGAARDRVYAAQAANFPQFAEYQAGTERIIPVFALTPA